MKKVISLILSLVLCVSLVSTAMAAKPKAVLSAQKFTVDGITVDCEKYNIDGSNYFKLRDLAYVLNGTATQFSVGFDAESRTVSIENR